MKNREQIILLLILLTISVGCGPSRAGDIYYRGQALQILDVVHGKVVSINPVRIQGEQGEAGALGGMALGGAIGNTIGGGSLNLLSIVGGGVIGLIAGPLVEERLGQREAEEIELEVAGGPNIVIVQEGRSGLSPGQEVRVVGEGRNRRVRPL